MNIIDRYKKPTPKFFKTIRNIGIAMATAGGTILASPMMLPEHLISLSGYLIIAGTIAATVSQAAVLDGMAPNQNSNNK